MKKHLFMIGTLLMALTCVPVQAKTKAPAAPERLQADCKNEKTMTLKWKKVKGAKGYIVYRANGKKKGKFKRIANIKKTSAKWRKYTDKHCKKNHIYRYKVKAYKKREHRLIKSKSSYVVMAKTYTYHAKKVNIKKLYPAELEEPIQIGHIADVSAGYKIDDKKGLSSVAFNKDFKYEVLDPSYGSIDGEGIFTAKDKAGTVKIRVRSCNGKQCTETFTIVDYTKPATFSEYNGKNNEINLLLRDYKDDITSIAHYFAVQGNKGATEEHKTEAAASLYLRNGIINYPNLENIDSIKGNVEHLLRNYPGDLAIHSSYANTTFKIQKGDVSISLIYEDEDYGLQKLDVAPHWSWSLFVPN